MLFKFKKNEVTEITVNTIFSYNCITCSVIIIACFSFFADARATAQIIKTLQETLKQRSDSEGRGEVNWNYCTLDAVSNAPTNENNSLTYQISSYINHNMFFLNATGHITTSEITIIYSIYLSL